MQAPFVVNNTTYYGIPSTSTAQYVQIPVYQDVFEIVSSWRLTIDELQSNGYPLIGQNGHQVQIEETFYERGRKMWIEKDDQSRQCSRCHAHFELDHNGDFPRGPSMCRYKARGETKFADFHVSAQRYISELDQFSTAPPSLGQMDPRNRSIYAMDCEMVQTTTGQSLARISLINFYGDLVLDLLIKPAARLVDPLTEYSGLTREQVENATETLETCREKLFSFANSETILVGHGLSSDLKALNLIHWNIVDTSVLFQNEMGHKVALRTLARNVLNREIQADTGHCSFEDAVAALDLLKYKMHFG